MAIQVDPIASPRIITVPEVDGNSITVQTLVNQIREWEDDPINLSYKKLLSASGKEDLGEGAFVGITAKLENAKVKFEARGNPTVCIVRGGNLVAVDANGDTMDVIEPSTNVTAIIAQSSSATLIEGTGSVWSEQEKDNAISDIEGIKTEVDKIPAVKKETDKISLVKTEADKIQPEIIDKASDYKANVSSLALEDGGRLQDIQLDLSFLKDIEGGRWKIVNNQMIFYKADNETEVARFNLFNKAGEPSEESVLERRRT